MLVISQSLLDAFSDIIIEKYHFSFMELFLKK